MSRAGSNSPGQPAARVGPGIVAIPGGVEHEAWFPEEPRRSTCSPRRAGFPRRRNAAGYGGKLKLLRVFRDADDRRACFPVQSAAKRIRALNQRAKLGVHDLILRDALASLGLLRMRSNDAITSGEYDPSR